MYYRKLQRVGSKTFSLNLPRDWVVKAGLQKGTNLEIRELDSGDLIMIEIAAKVKQGGENYLMVEDYLAPGFRPVSDDSLYFSRDYPKEYLTMESYDDRIVLFASDFGDKTVFRYFVRAELPGKYRILPVKASRMYYPNVTGSSSDYEIEIRN